MLRFGFLLTLLVASAFAATNVQKCTKNPGPLPSSTTIKGCVDPPCELPQLEDSVTQIVFDAPRSIQSMKTVATAYWYGIPIPYDLGDQAITCNHLTNTQCPVSSGTTVEYTLTMYIEAAFPAGTSVTTEYQILDESGEALVCVRVPVKIVKPRSKAIEA